LTRPWAFGDELPIDAPRTVANALRRGGVTTLPRPASETADSASPPGDSALPPGGSEPPPGGSAAPPRGRRPGMTLLVEDFEAVETERGSSAAVALCVDLSFSMVQEGRWGPMKQTALALAHLVETRFRQDALQIIGFNLAARRLTPVQLAEAEPEW